MKYLALLALATISLQAKDNPNQYVVETSTTALTVQRQTNGSKQLAFRYAVVACAADQTATLSWNGTAATATLTTPKRLPGAAPPQATVYTASDVGSGTTGPTYKVATSPGGYVIDLSPFVLGSTRSGTNLTISTTGTCTITIAWGEE